MWILDGVALGRLTRLSALVFALWSVAVPALAGPRLVRVIWDVGRGAVFYREFPETERGQDSFAVPENAAEAASKKFALMTSTDILRKGDRVRLYVVNYNPVSHVWHESSTVEQIEEAPSRVGPLLNALALALTGAAPAPSANFTIMAQERAAPPPPQGCPLGDVQTALDQLSTSATEVGQATAALVKEADDKDLTTAAKKLAALPTHRVMWATFDDRAAWDAVRYNTQVFGLDFEAQFGALEAQIKDAKSRINSANARVLDLDRAIAALPLLQGNCLEIAKSHLERRTRIVAFLRETAGPESPFREVVARYDAAQSTWELYVSKLRDAGWTAEAIELVVKDPIKQDVVLRVDAAFASPDKEFVERTQRSLVLGVQPDIPFLVISSGIALNGFDFKKLQVAKTAVTGSDGVVSAKDKFQTVADTSWNRIVPIWLENIRLMKLPRAGIYGTFGTTPDRNIFKNAIVGGSVYVPKWRTAFTVGTLFARGYVQDDLDPVIKEFSDPSGFALGDVTADNVPLPSPSFHPSLFVAATFKLLGF
jgi:hypothetical protein